MQVPRSLEELEKILSRKWFIPEARIYREIWRSCSNRYRSMMINYLIVKLRKKGVVLNNDLIEELYRIPCPEKKPRRRRRKSEQKTHSEAQGVAPGR